ncbi:MAG TPA: cupin domain-containing protein [Acidimicrobiales bacterium]|nr:cupin domain-containing protein [Acidimicrobiales bacterium]
MTSVTERSGPAGGSWMFLGVRFDVLTAAGAPVVVAEFVLPEGASPPLHVHEGLDDSFYVLDGTMVIRCGPDVWLAGPGSWVQFPAGVPHTFRVLGGPLRALMVHSDDSFLAAVRAVGRPAVDGDQPDAAPELSLDELDRALSAHGVTTVGAPMERDEAEAWLTRLAPAPS